MMISIFHPSSLFCSSEDWINRDFQDIFTNNLIEHLQRVREFKIKIAMSSDFESYFWANKPWNSSDDFYKKKLYDIYYRMQERFEFFTSPPETICQTEPNIQNEFSEEARRLWLILIHRLLFNKMETLVLIGATIIENMDSVEVFCNCDHERTRDRYTIIKKSQDWYVKIDYMEKCPENIDLWDEDFRLAIKMCREKFNFADFRTKPEKISFSSNFKNCFLELQEIGKKDKIIKSITKLLTLDHQEARRDSGLQEELINGKFSIRVSQGDRIHYIENEGGKIFLEYFPASGHDTHRRRSLRVKRKYN